MLKAHTLLIEVGQAVQPSGQPRPSTLAHLRTYAEVPGDDGLQAQVLSAQALSAPLGRHAGTRSLSTCRSGCESVCTP